MSDTINRTLTILLLSGPVAVGKTSVASELVASCGFARIRSGAFLSAYALARGLAADRNGLQQLGDRLDVETDYRWLVDDVAVPAIRTEPLRTKWLVDAVRKQRQVEHFRKAYPSGTCHAHMFLPEAALRRRYDARLDTGSEYTGRTPYDVAVQHPNEMASRSLIEIADLVLDVSGMTAQQVSAAILKAMTCK